jgi:hypothetical protein
LNSLTLTVKFIEEAICKSLPISFEMAGIDKLRTQLFTHNPTLHRYSARIEFLRHVMEPQIASLPRISAQICASALDSEIGVVDVENDFAASSLFDNLMFDFLKVRGIQSIDEVASALSPHIAGVPTEPPSSLELEFPVKTLIGRKARMVGRIPGMVKSPDPYPFLKLYLSLVKLLNANTTEKQILLKSTLIRIVSDRLYLIDPLLNDFDENAWKNLQIIRKLTFGDMAAPAAPFGVTPDFVIGELSESNPVIQAVSEHVEALQFDRNPLDLAYHLSMVCTAIEGLNESLGSGTEMSFDDYFTIFLVMFSVAPPRNFTGISYLFAVFEFMEYSASLKHAITTFSAWASFAKNFMRERHPPDVKKKIEAILQEIS